MLFDSIRASLIRARFPKLRNKLILRKLKKWTGGLTERLEDVRNCPTPVQKTHDLFNAAYSDDAKFVFVYGDPLESALSVKRTTEERGLDWFQEHLRNLHSEGGFEDLFLKDILNYERQLDSWRVGDPEKVLILRYEQIWDRVDDLSSFLGFPVFLPPRRRRETKIARSLEDPVLFQYLRTVMRSLDRQIGYSDDLN
jgi:hypothetical protein